MTKNQSPIVADPIERLVRSLKQHGVDGVDLAFVLGSGLGVFADRLEKARAIPYAELDGMPRSAVPGHAGRLVVGEIAGKRLVVQQGRVHLYEGWSEREVTRAIRAFAAIGVKGVVLTNAAGGLHAEWKPGTLMRVTDHINQQGAAPLLPRERGSGTPYDAEFGAALTKGAKEARVPLEAGVYAGLLGPTYETPAEIRMLRWAGADAVGMSTVAEAMTARAAGMKVAAVSCITNLAAGISKEPLSHAEVMAAGKAVATRFCKLLEKSVPHLADAVAR
ncbi:MAG: purine-nucleoside phosphorylase [Planctomycetes bacterium]|nr:purine-nucleoside phosphorylase [Planctomycetota bacterium]